MIVVCPQHPSTELNDEKEPLTRPRLAFGRPWHNEMFPDLAGLGRFAPRGLFRRRLTASPPLCVHGRLHAIRCAFTLPVGSSSFELTDHIESWSASAILDRCLSNLFFRGLTHSPCPSTPSHTRHAHTHARAPSGLMTAVPILPYLSSLSVVSVSFAAPMLPR